MTSAAGNRHPTTIIALSDTEARIEGPSRRRASAAGRPAPTQGYSPSGANQAQEQLLYKSYKTK